MGEELSTPLKVELIMMYWSPRYLGTALKMLRQKKI